MITCDFISNKMTTVVLSGKAVSALISRLRPTCNAHYMSIAELLRGKSDEFLSHCGFPPVPHKCAPREYMACLLDLSQKIPCWIIPFMRAIGANRDKMQHINVPDYLVGKILDDGYVVPPCRIDTSSGLFQVSGSKDMTE